MVCKYACVWMLWWVVMACMYMGVWVLVPSMPLQALCNGAGTQWEGDCTLLTLSQVP